MPSSFRLGLLPAALAASLALAGCNTSNNYFAVEQDEETKPSTAFGMVLGMTGMVPTAKRPIDYKPRAPLAMPGSSDLPSPESGAAAEQAVNFPVDHDDQARARQRELNARGREAAYEATFTDNGARRLAAGEAGKQVRSAPNRLPPSERSNSALNDLKFEQDARLTRKQMTIRLPSTNKHGELITEEGKPAPRTHLAQPPEQYRVPADTAPLPEKGDIENTEWAKSRLYKREDKRPARMIK